MSANHIICVSIYQISEQQFSRVQIGYRKSKYPWLFTICNQAKMASRFEKFSEDGIRAINEEVVQTNTKKATNISLSVFTGSRKLDFCKNALDKISEMF